MTGHNDYILIDEVGKENFQNKLNEFSRQGYCMFGTVQIYKDGDDIHLVIILMKWISITAIN